MFRSAYSAFYLATLLVLIGCQSDPEPVAISADSAAKNYIIEYTSGVISSRSAIEVVLAEDLGVGIQPGTALDEDLFEMDPKVAGKTVWRSSNTLAFEPAEPLRSGTPYLVKFHLGKLKSVPKELKTLEFSIKVITQGFDVNSYELDPYQALNFEWNRLIVNFQSYDVSSVEEISERFEVRGMSSDRMHWNHIQNQHFFSLTLDSIQRLDAESNLYLTDGGEVVDTLRVPSISNFTLISSDVDQFPNQRIKLVFTSPLSPSQRLTGMFQIDGEDVDRVEIQGSVVELYPAHPMLGEVSFRVAQGLLTARGEALQQDVQGMVEFFAEKPAVKFASSGNVVAGNGQAIIPISTVSLRAVDVKVYRVFESNVLQFFQSNSLSGSRKLRAVARPIVERRIDLGTPRDSKWVNYGLRLDELIEREPGAIYRIVLSFKPSYSTFPCSEPVADLEDWNEEDPDEFEESYYDYYWSYEGYSYRERDNPCHLTYYIENSGVSKNILVSDIGLVVKGSEGNWHAYTSWVSTGKAIDGARVEFFNYQGQSMGMGTTQTQGKVSLQLSGRPFLAVASKGREKAYIKLEEGASLSVSSFDVGGQDVSSGIQAMWYAERGIWRPGDTIHLDAVLQDHDNPLPKDHPLVMKLYNSKDQLVLRKVVGRGTHALFNWDIPTEKDWPTGTYKAELVIGGKVYSKLLPIETIQPNRLDVMLGSQGDVLKVESDNTTTFDLRANWLTGPAAKDLKYEIKGKLTKWSNAFEDGWSDYNFFDAQRTTGSLSSGVLVSGNLSAEGHANPKVDLGYLKDEPGPLLFQSYTRVYEPSGRFSIASNQIPLSPHPSYVGIKLPNMNQWGWYDTETEHEIGLALLDINGTPKSGTVEVEVYEVSWSWWYASTGGSSNHISSDSKELISSQEVKLSRGTGSFKLNIPDRHWGRILIVAKDKYGTHSSSGMGYFDWAYNRDRSKRSDEQNVQTLSLELDQETYKVGDEVRIKVPSAAGSRLIVSLENGRDQLADQVVTTEAGYTEVAFTLTKEMAPNVFAHAMIIQPFENRGNHRPLRLYGIEPIQIVDPESKLQPVLSAPEILAPNSTLQIKVKEKEGRAMEYTLAVVDEGLLGLNNFKTPDPHAYFGRRQALGVRTWDSYEWIMNAFGGRLEKILAIGGDAALLEEVEDDSDRFKSVVQHLGPFQLSKGGLATHAIPIENYMGKVRIMVVAANTLGASGSSEAQTTVKQDLMVQLTLPRQLAPEEELDIPVTVFAMKPKLGKVNISLSTNPMIQLLETSKTITFQEEGQQTVYFRARVSRKVGTAEVRVKGISGSIESSEQQRVNVRYVVPRQTRSQSFVVTDTAALKQIISPFGIPEAHAARVQISTTPSMRLGERIDYLVRYPHGCLEQISSQGFAQLNLDHWVELTATQKQEVRSHVLGALNQIQKRQVPEGGFKYWPSSHGAHPWASTYAGHFMVSAKEQGYDLPNDLLNTYLRYERRTARNWSPSTSTNSEIAQAYRLYVLALAGQPELGAMTRLKNQITLSNRAKILLATAYAKSGEEKIANELIDRAQIPTEATPNSYEIFGSRLRDRAMWLEAMAASSVHRERAFQLSRELIADLGTGWHSTQEIAYTLQALTGLYRTQNTTGSQPQATVLLEGKKLTLQSLKKSKELIVMHPDLAQSLEVENSETGALFVDIIQSGIPLYGEEGAFSNGLNVEVRYLDANQNELNVRQVKVGEPITVQIKVFRNQPGTSDAPIALRQPVADGWEVTNSRLEGITGSATLDYQDFRDDHILSYFNLKHFEYQMLEFEMIATYPGKYYLPGTYVEAMYDGNMQAATPGQWVVVERK